MNAFVHYIWNISAVSQAKRVSLSEALEFWEVLSCGNAEKELTAFFQALPVFALICVRITHVARAAGSPSDKSCDPQCPWLPSEPPVLLKFQHLSSPPGSQPSSSTPSTPHLSEPLPLLASLWTLAPLKSPRISGPPQVLLAPFNSLWFPLKSLVPLKSPWLPSKSSVPLKSSRFLSNSWSPASGPGSPQYLTPLKSPWLPSEASNPLNFLWLPSEASDPLRFPWLPSETSDCLKPPWRPPIPGSILKSSQHLQASRLPSSPSAPLSPPGPWRLWGGRAEGRGVTAGPGPPAGAGSGRRAGGSSGPGPAICTGAGPSPPQCPPLPAPCRGSAPPRPPSSCSSCSSFPGAAPRLRAPGRSWSPAAARPRRRRGWPCTTATSKRDPSAGSGRSGRSARLR